MDTPTSTNEVNGTVTPEQANGNLAEAFEDGSTKLQRFFDALNKLNFPFGCGPRGPGLTHDRLKAQNARAGSRALLVAMRREMPESTHDEKRIHAAIEKRHRRQVRNLLGGGKVLGQ